MACTVGIAAASTFSRVLFCVLRARIRASAAATFALAARNAAFAAADASIVTCVGVASCGYAAFSSAAFDNAALVYAAVGYAGSDSVVLQLPSGCAM